MEEYVSVPALDVEEDDDNGRAFDHFRHHGLHWLLCYT